MSLQVGYRLSEPVLRESGYEFLASVVMVDAA